MKLSASFQISNQVHFVDLIFFIPVKQFKKQFINFFYRFSSSFLFLFEVKNFDARLAGNFLTFCSPLLQNFHILLDQSLQIVDFQLFLRYRTNFVLSFLRSVLQTFHSLNRDILTIFFLRNKLLLEVFLKTLFYFKVVPDVFLLDRWKNLTLNFCVQNQVYVFRLPGNLSLNCVRVWRVSITFHMQIVRVVFLDSFGKW